MKKILILAGVLALMACNSEDSGVSGVSMVDVDQQSRQLVASLEEVSSSSVEVSSSSMEISSSSVQQQQRISYVIPDSRLVSLLKGSHRVLLGGNLSSTWYLDQDYIEDSLPSVDSTLVGGAELLLEEENWVPVLSMPCWFLGRSNNCGENVAVQKYLLDGARTAGKVPDLEYSSVIGHRVQDGFEVRITLIKDTKVGAYYMRVELPGRGICTGSDQVPYDVGSFAAACGDMDGDGVAEEPANFGFTVALSVQ